jgi:predicted Zn-dependent protease
LQPLLDNLQALGVPVAEIPELPRRYIDDAHARAVEPVQPSNDGSDIEAAISASRDKLRVLDVLGARDVLQAKIIDEEQARLRRLVPLLKERAWVERLAFDYDAAKSTLGELTTLAPDDVWTWIDLGDLSRTTGSLDDAARAYRNAEAAAHRGGSERDLSVSHDRIGDVLVAQGDRNGALKAYQAGLAIREALARRDPANTEWQRDLIVSCVKISEIDPAQAPTRLSRALEIARGLETTGRLAPVDNWIPDELARRLAAAK